MPVKRMKDFLDSQKVKYVSIVHSPAFTAQEVAASAHVSGKEMAKTVIVELDGKMAMAVLPANQKVVLQDLREATGSNTVSLVAETKLKELFPDCEVGGMPPFGNLYGMPVFVSPALGQHAQMAFNAGSHTELIQMAYQDFARLVQPRVLSFTT